MNGRDLRIDAIKGILIILVILGHALFLEFKETSWETPLFNGIYCFHMPAFIFISGYFFPSSLKKNFSNVVSQKFKRLIVPALFFSSIIGLIYILSPEFIECGLDFKLICLLIIEYWYLICLYCLTLLYYYLIKGKLVYKILIGLFYIIGIYLYYSHPIVMIIDCQVIRMFLCFGAGVVYSMYKTKISNLLIAIIFFISIIIVISNRFCNGYVLTSYSPIFRILDGLSFCFISIPILFFVVKVLPKKIMIFFANNGRYSLSLYLIHMLIYRAFLFGHYYLGRGTYKSLILFIVMYVLSLLICRLIVKSCNPQYKYLFGLS